MTETTQEELQDISDACIQGISVDPKHLLPVLRDADRLAQIERDEQQAVIVSVIPADAGWDVGLGPDGDTWITVPMEMGRPEVGQIVRFLPPAVTGIDTPDE